VFQVVWQTLTCSGRIAFSSLILASPMKLLAYQDAVSVLLASPSKQGPPESEEAQFERRCSFFNSVAPKFVSKCTIVHVAGSKGKGSVCELLRSCAIAGHRTVGIFTSPHLHTVRERIRVGSELIPQTSLARITTRLVHCLNGCCSAALCNAI
jgi:folylpolyglutamate synthase/dihydropteroate synthase